MDMSNTYRDVVQLCLPKARIVADRFHVVRRVGKALDQVRLRLQRQLSARSEEGSCTSFATPLLGRPEQVDGARSGGVCVGCSRTSPELHTAWRLKEGFRRWYETEDRAHGRAGVLAEWEEEVRQSGIAEFIQLSQGPNAMLIEWREEILNYFDTELTNGFVEGKNNRTKVIQRQAYGYRNPANLRLRVLLPSRLTCSPRGRRRAPDSRLSA